MSSHPYFDNHGAVSWFVDYEAAKAEARRTGKLLFIESGRRACVGCKELIETIVPQPDVAKILNEHFVCCSDDCDAMAPAVRSLLVKHLPRGRMLPFVLLTDSEARWLGGSSGSTTAEDFRTLLRAAIDRPLAESRPDP